MRKIYFLKFESKQVTFQESLPYTLNLHVVKQKPRDPHVLKLHCKSETDPGLEPLTPDSWNSWFFYHFPFPLILWS